MWFLCLIFVVQVAVTILSHETERHYHNGTLFSFNLYSIVCKISYCFIGWFGLGKGDGQVVLVALLAGIIGDMVGAMRFRKEFEEKGEEDGDNDPAYYLWD